MTEDDPTGLLILEHPNLGHASASFLKHSLPPRTLALSKHRDQREEERKEEDKAGREKKKAGGD
jgi:hypothetical protein